MHIPGGYTKGNVKVCLNTEATPDLVKEGAPEAVFLAVGGKPIIPPLPGTEKAVLAGNVILAMGTRANKDAITAFEAAFARVVLIGQTAKNPGRIATSMFDGYVTARGYEPGI